MISIHAPREGCDPYPQDKVTFDAEFQSTHSVRGATLWGRITKETYFISIHAPREGCDHHAFFGYVRQVNFNPRTP